MNRLIEDEIKRQELEKEAKKEYYNVLKNSGIFFEWYPHLTGNWKEDKIKHLNIYRNILNMWEFNEEQQYFTKKDKTEDLTFTTLEKETLSDKQQKELKTGVKDSQTTLKAPIFTYCKVNKNALEKLSFRALYGHNKYEVGDDWENFTRVENGDFEYSNSLFRHALEIGEEDEEGHLVSVAWNAISRLEVYLRNKTK
jgi:hypothetical protein